MRDLSKVYTAVSGTQRSGWGPLGALEMQSPTSTGRSLGVPSDEIHMYWLQYFLHKIQYSKTECQNVQFRSRSDF